MPEPTFRTGWSIPLMPIKTSGGPRAKLVAAQSVGVLVAAGLVAAATANVLAARRAEKRNPPTGGFVEVDGVRLHYLERGAGPVVVLVHGNMVSASDFAISGLMERLSQSHRVIAFDRPGFGHSTRPRDRIWTARAQAELLWKALGRLGVEAPVVLGHSFGSLVALNVGLDHPGRIAGLVLMSGYYRPTPRPDIPLAGAAAVPVLGDLLRFTISPLFGRATLPLVVKAMFSPAGVPARFKRGYASSMAVRPSALRAAGGDALSMALDAARSGRLSKTDLPLLIVSGRKDRIVDHRHQSERLARDIPRARLHVVEDGGHMVHHTATDEVVGAIRTFLATVEPARSDRVRA